MDDRQIFISYSRNDKDAVETIVSRIEAELYNDICWIDVDGIESGQMFWDIIIRAINRCNVFLLMASNDSMSSDNVLGEIQIAKNNSKSIVPVIINKDVLKNDRFLAYFPINNYILADNPEHMSRLIYDLKNWCHIGSLEHESVAADVENSSADVCLKVLPNLECRVLIDCEEKAIAQAERLTKIPLQIGEYYAEFISTENSADALSLEIVIEHDKLVKVDLLSLKQAREKAERLEQNEKERLSRIKSVSLYPYISNNKVGFVDLGTLEIIIPCKYDFVKVFSEGLAAVKINDKWGFIDKLGYEVVPCIYNAVGDFAGGVARVVKNRKVGVLDISGNEVIPCIYEAVGFSSNGLINVELNSKWGFIDKSGNEIISCKYDLPVLRFCDGIARVQMRRKYGYIDENGNECVPCIYDYGYDFNDGMARVESGIKWGFVDKSGREVIPCKYDEVSDFRDGISIVRVDGISKFGQYRIIDKSGYEVVLSKYKYASYYGGNYISVGIGQKSGFINTNGHEVIPCKYEQTSLFHDGVCRVQLNGKWGFIDESGNEIIPCKYDKASYLQEGMVSVAIKKMFKIKWGVVDRSGYEVISCKYDKVHDFKGGVAFVQLNGKWGALDKYGCEIIPCKYDEVRDLKHGLALVQLNGKWGLISSISGRLITACVYESFFDDFSGALARVKLNGRKGYIDCYGNESTPCKYDDAYSFENGLAQVQLNGKWGYIDLFGNEMWLEEQ